MNNVTTLWGRDGELTLVTFEHSVVTLDPSAKDCYTCE